MRKEVFAVFIMACFFATIPVKTYAFNSHQWNTTRDLVRLELWKLGLRKINDKKHRSQKLTHLSIEIKKPLNELFSH